MMVEVMTYLAFIILVEAMLLKLFFRTIRWWRHLLCSVIINILSVGIVYLFIRMLENIAVPFGFLLPLLMLLITEYILILFLYRRASSYAKTTGIVLTLNLSSYLLFFIASMMFSSIAGSIYCYREKSSSYAEKNSHDLLKDELGAIYTVKQYGQLNCDCALDKYDIDNMQWQEIPNSRDCDVVFYYQCGWDISKNFIAYPKGSQFSIFQRQDLSEIKQFFIEADELKFSPDEKFITALTHDGDISIEKDMSNFNGGVLIRNGDGVPIETLGRNSILTIIDISISRIIRVEDEFVIYDDGVSWSPDCKKLLLTSVKNQAEFTASIKNNNDSNLILEKNIPKYVCEYNLSSRILKPLFEGFCGRYSPDGKEILFIKDDNFMLYSCDSGNIRNLHKTYSHRPFFQWSPSGKSIAAFEQVSGIQNMFSSRIYVMSIENPNKMLIIGDKQNYYGLRWINE